MEHMSDDRKAVWLDAVVGCPRFGLIRGRITELGDSDLYIRADTCIVPLGAAVTVTFQPHEGICADCLCVSGRVTAQSRQGFTVALEDLDDTCRAVLAELNAIAPAPAVPLQRAG